MSLGSAVLLPWQVRGIGSENNSIKNGKKQESIIVFFVDFNFYHLRSQYFLKISKMNIS